MKEKDYLYLEKGTILKNSYLIEELMGERSNFSIIYEAQDLINKRKVAIKEFFPKNIALRDMDKKTVLCKNSNFSKRFREEVDKFWNEGKIIQKIRGNNCVKCFDIFEENNTAYIVMKYHEGQDLEKHIREGVIGELEIFLEKIVYPITETIEKIHEYGYIHRDIKPSNIIMEDLHKPILIDFGSAINYRSEGEKNILVTPGFSPIEFYSEKSKQNIKSDVYSVAAMMYYYFSGETPPEATKRIIEDNIVDLSVYNEEIPFLLKKIIMKNLSMNIKNRDASMKKFRNNIKKAILFERVKRKFINKKKIIGLKKA